MYGDEKHSSVLLNEIDGFQTRFDMMRKTFEGFRSRTVYGRSARGHKPTRRQPRPQLFEDDRETTTTTPGEPATIFRVVTETSIKVGEAAVTHSMVTSQETSSVSYEPAIAEFDNYVTATTHTDHTMTQTVDTTTTEATTNPTTTEAAYTTTESMPTTVSSAPTTVNVQNDVPIAMERVGYEDFEEEYEYEPKRKSDSVLQNSVEDKIRYKEEFDSDVKRTDPSKFEGNIDGDLVAEASVEEEREENEPVAEEEESTTEEVPRRGM